MLTFQPSIHPLGEAIPESPDSVPSGPKPAQVFMGSVSRQIRFERTCVT